ncbi:MAG: MFS transporter [Faecalibacillus sp.]
MIRKKKIESLTMMTMFVFIVMNFVLSMSTYLFNGILDKIAVDLNVPLSQTGYLTSFYTYGAGIGVPIFLVLFRKFDRSLLLKWMLFLNIIVTSLSIVSPNFIILLIMRVLMGLTGNCYGVLATANIAILSPKEKVGKNLALLITGSASALMIGIPLTRTLSELYTWESIFVVLVIIMIASLIYFLLRLPDTSKTMKPMNLKSEYALLTQKSVIIVIVGSLITFIGYGAFYTYLTPYLIGLFPQLEMIMSILLIIIGFCSFFGNLLGGFICDRIGFYKSYMVGTILQIVISICMFLTKDFMLINLIFVFLWMINAWFIGLQNNTAITVVTQNKSSLMISLNSSGVQLGQAIGASVAAFIMTGLGIPAIIFISTITSSIVLILFLINKKKIVLK